MILEAGERKGPAWRPVAAQRKRHSADIEIEVGNRRKDASFPETLTPCAMNPNAGGERGRMTSLTVMRRNFPRS